MPSGPISRTSLARIRSFIRYCLVVIAYSLPLLRAFMYSPDALNISQLFLDVKSAVWPRLITECPKSCVAQFRIAETCYLCTHVVYW
jgi:hypothetical protein